jgi:hypothetical protein
MKNIELNIRWIIFLPLAFLAWYFAAKIISSFLVSIIETYQSDHPYEYWENRINGYTFWLFRALPQLIPAICYFFIGITIAPKKTTRTASILIAVYVAFWLLVIFTERQLRQDLGLLSILLSVQAIGLFLSYRYIKSKEGKNFEINENNDTIMFNENKFTDNTNEN